MNIAVVAGGISTERDVSLSSGAQVARALMSRGHKVCLIDLFFGIEQLPADLSELFTDCPDGLGRSVSADAPDIEAVKAMRTAGASSTVGLGVVEVCRFADMTYLALHGGDGENGKVQAFFDLQDIRYTGSTSFGCALAMHKWVSKQMMISAGVPVPKGVLLKKNVPFDQDTLPLPGVVKPCCGGSSIGISIANTREEMNASIEDAFRYEDEVLVEEYIAGTELSAGILGGEALPLIEIVPREGFYDYAHKYQPGWTEEITPARLDGRTTVLIQEMAKKAYKSLGLSVYSRIDFLLTAGGCVYCLEANTLPGMTPTSLLPQEAAAVGISYEELCDRIVELSLAKYE